MSVAFREERLAIVLEPSNLSETERAARTQDEIITGFEALDQGKVEIGGVGERALPSMVGACLDSEAFSASLALLK